MDFLEDIFDFGDRKHRNRDGVFHNGEHHDHDDDHDEHNDHRFQNSNNTYPQVSTNPGPILSGVICRKCSTPTFQGAKFCHGCGAAIETTTICASCGSKLPDNILFCPQCGYKNR
jgi:hypothetical protein